jgi:protein tyrosine phosphatase
MIWEQKSLVIVAVIKVINNIKDHPVVDYWAKQTGDSVKFWVLSIKTVATEDKGNFILSMLNVTNLKTNEVRQVAHLKFLKWNDFDTPPSTQAAIDIVEGTRKVQSELLVQLGDSWRGNPWGPPIIVHCLGGFGRTGSLWPFKHDGKPTVFMF